MESEETTSTEINNPGAYSTVCVELDVASLAVNTIIEVLCSPFIAHLSVTWIWI